jgi:hypothetical protein
MYKGGFPSSGVTIRDLFDSVSNPSICLHRPPPSQLARLSKLFPDFVPPSPSYSLIFNSPFPESISRKLSSEITKLRSHRSLYFSRSFLPSSSLPPLCEAFLLFSTAPASFLTAFLRFDWIPLLLRVFEVDRGPAAELVLRTFSNCARGSSELAGVLLSAPAFSVIRDCFDSASVALRQHSLFCLSCLCDHASQAAFAEAPFRLFSQAIRSELFCEGALRGLSRLSFHRPDLIVTNGLLSVFFAEIRAGAELRNQCCLFAIQNTVRFDPAGVVPLLIENGIVRMFEIAIDCKQSHRTEVILRIICAIVCEAAPLSGIADEIAESGLIQKVQFYLFEGQHGLKISAFEFVAVLLETSSVYRSIVLDSNIFSVILITIDSVEIQLAVRLLNGIEKALTKLESKERELFIGDFACLFEISHDLDEELARSVQRLEACFSLN